MLAKRFMTAIYENKGFKFQYPENWNLTDIEDGELPFQFALEAPSGGQWSVNVFPLDQEDDQLTDDAITALKSQYEDVEFSMSELEFGDQKVKTIDAHFIVLDFVVRAQIFVVTVQDNKLLFWFQAESRDFDTQTDVFRAITMSMLRSTDPVL